MLNMREDSAFVTSRRNVQTKDQMKLSDSLLRAGWDNIFLSQHNCPMQVFKFHTINKNGFAVTILVTNKNRLVMRGKSYTRIYDLLVALDKIVS